MTRMIPDKDLERFIQSTGWVPGREPFQPKIPPVTKHQHVIQYSIDDILEGKTFYDNNLPDALQQALDYAGIDGVVASMPYLIAGKSQADTSSYLWENWFTALSEEDVGIDKSGKFVKAGSPVVVIVHGGGILTPDRIQKAYGEGLTGQNAAKFKDEEFDNLLEGVLPSGESVEIYTVEDVQNGSIPNPFGRYGVVVDFETANSKFSGLHLKGDFMNDELVLARAGTLDYLDAYFEKAKRSGGKVGNWHRLNEIDPNQAQGRVLFLYDNCDGLVGDDDLGNDGCFVGVAPEARRARK